MSTRTRRAIAMWFMLIFGIMILLMQGYRFFTDSLELNIGNFLVTIIAAVFILRPHSLSNTYTRIISSRINGKNDDTK